jgi:hypothetical protein
MMLFGVLDSGNFNPFYAIAVLLVSSASPNFQPADEKRATKVAS